MRLGIRATEAIVVSLLTLLVVATTSVMHLSHLTRVVVEETAREADLITRQVYAQSSRSLARGGDPVRALQRDRELRSLLEASIGYSPHLLDAMIVDRAGRVRLHSEREKEGSAAPARPRLSELLAVNAVRRFHALYTGGRVYDATLPIRLDAEPFGSIRLGVSTSLLRRELNAAVMQTLVLAGLALPVAWLVAMGLGSLALKPLRALSREMARLGRGELEVGGDLAGRGEVGELASQLQRVGRELHADRVKMLSEKAQLQRMVDHLEDGVVFLNAERRVLFFNRAAEAVMGGPLEEAVGCALEERLGPSHPLRALVDRAFERETGLRNATIALPRDDSTNELLVSIVFVSDAERVTGAMVLLRDLKSMKALRSLITYSAKLAELGGLTSGVAHEIKNPLNAMTIHAEILKEKLAGASGDAEQNLAVIRQEIRRLDRMVQGFLRFVRPQELKLTHVDVNGVLSDVAALLDAEWKTLDVRFAFELDRALPLVTGDAELLRQAFLNVVQNACQAMPGGGTVRMTTRVERGGEFLTVSVADDGAGIPPDDLDKIFKLYYTTKPGGNGIGLSLVFRIVQMHDGVIEVSSEVGGGTTMTVRLPLR